VNGTLTPSAAALAAVLVFAACGEDEPPEPSGAAANPAAAGVNALTGGTPEMPGAAAPPADQAASANLPPDDDGAEATSDEDPSDIPYAYSPIGKRDPFRNLFEVEDSKDDEELTELQKYELDQLKLVAVVSRIATPYAMVEDPKGKGHTLTRGTLIGKNWGQVAQIRPDCVVVREEYRDYTGRKVTNRTSLCLPRPEELKLD